MRFARGINAVWSPRIGKAAADRLTTSFVVAGVGVIVMVSAVVLVILLPVVVGVASRSMSAAVDGAYVGFLLAVGGGAIVIVGLVLRARALRMITAMLAHRDPKFQREDFNAFLKAPRKFDAWSAAH